MRRGVKNTRRPDKTREDTLRHHRLLVIAMLGFALLTAPVLGQTVLEVISLKHRTAEDMIPVLTPMLAREGSLSGMRGQLIVRTTPANLEELRRILLVVDVAPRRLLITVAQDVAAERSRRGADVALRTDDHLRLTVPGAKGAPRDGVEVRILDARNADSLRVMQTVQVIDGGTAYVQTGQSSPVPQQRVTRSVVGGRVVEQVVESVEYRNVGTGFHVLPRVAGDRVTLDLSPHREALMRHVPGMVDVQRVVTTVSGRLGEWIDVGGVSDQRGSEREVLLGRSTSTYSERRNIVVKVEELR